jgi:patatin-like phospholipase/acyl hydrolase
MEQRPFCILSLDGGGIKGAFAASALATFEQATGRRAVEHFDLIAGTSTGCITALGLAMGAPAEEIARFYELGA